MPRMIFWIMLLSMAGCGSPQPTGDVVKVVPASGVLTLKGQPLEYYQVSTFPESGRPAVGVTDAAGTFVLGTNAQNDGAMVGSHKVSVTWVGPPNTDPNEGIMEITPPPPPKVKINPKYENAETSGLTIMIPDGGIGDLKVDLQ